MDNNSDDDGIKDKIEVTNCIYGEDNNQCTNPNQVDSDFDGVSDWDEIYTYYTDPKNPETDRDGLSDDLEINNLESKPLSND